jgi:hypothetical protein
MQGERMLVTDLGCVQIQEGCERCARVSLACRGAESLVLGENRGKRKLPGAAAANRSGASVDTGVWRVRGSAAGGAGIVGILQRQL